jgi:long-chain acyl-CoA synthetase
VKKLVEHHKHRPKRLAVQYFKRGQLYSLNWRQVYDRVEQIYHALRDQGVGRGDRVAIYSDTCKEWGFADLAIMACGATTVPIYHSSHAHDIQIILEETKPKLIFIQNEVAYNTIRKVDFFPQVSQVVVFDEFSPSPEDALTLTRFIDKPADQMSLKQAAAEIELDDLASIIYTSGTSGRPKGVCLQHRQIMSSVGDVFPLLGVTTSDKTLTFLPLSHVLARMELWGHYFCGYTLGYAESVEKIKRNLPLIQPTVIVGVPRIFEKIYFGIQAQVEISKLKQGLFKRALKIGREIKELRRKKKSPSFLQAIESQLAYQLVYSKIQEKFGGKLRFAVSGGAPLDAEIADIFAACDIPILEGYGLTETTGPVFVNTLFENRSGSVGKKVGDTQIKFAEDGEIFLKSEKVMSSYWLNSEATQQAFDEDGFFKTGDIGELDSEGFLRITDRKKDLIKTAGGKFVAPQKLQNLFASNPLIDHIHIHGDKEKYVVALVTLDKEHLMQLKERFKISTSDYSQLVRSDRILAEVRRAIARVNAELASFETIKRFEVLDHPFSVAGGQLTPSLKMRRKVIDEMYQKQIQALY